MMLRHRSIATILAVSLVVTTTVVLMAFAALSFWLDYNRARRQLAADTGNIAAQLAISLQSPAWSFDRPQIEGLLDSIMQDADVYAVLVQLEGDNRYGRLRDADWRAVPSGVAPQRMDLYTARRDIVNNAPARVGFAGAGGETLGSVSVYTSFDIRQQQLRRTLLLTVMAILVSDLVLIAMLYLLAWLLVMRPLKALRAHAAAVAGGADEVAGLRDRHFRGEFEELRVSLAATLQQLRDRYRDLQHEQQRFRALVSDIQRLQDAEQRRLGRDLHDSTGQVLVALEINLARLQRRSTDPDPDTRRLLDESVNLAKQALDEIRTTSYLLHPPLLDELGLATALRWLAEGFRKRSDIRLHVVVPEQLERLRPEVELALFRVAQEALTNVHRHSGARSAEIRLNCDAESIALCVSDTGHGMSTTATGMGVGLAAMRERIQQVGGDLDVASGPAGTAVTARWRFGTEQQGDDTPTAATE